MEIDADVVGARFEADGRLTVQVIMRLVEGDACVVKSVRLAEPTPADGGGVKALATIADANIALGPDKTYEGALTWPIAASERARALGRAIVVFEPDAGTPFGIGFDFAPAAPAPRKRSWTPLVFLAVAALGAALAIASRTC
jgi:hypothetical protein